MEPQTPTAEKPAPQTPVMDVRAPSDANALAKPPAEEAQPEPAKAEKPALQKPVQASVPKTPKSHNGNVTLAIVATVIIVLGMGALTVYAYLKQTNSL